MAAPSSFLARFQAQLEEQASRIIDADALGALDRRLADSTAGTDASLQPRAAPAQPPAAPSAPAAAAARPTGPSSVVSAASSSAPPPPSRASQPPTKQSQPQSQRQQQQQQQTASGKHVRLVEPTPRDDVDIDAEDLAPSLRRLIDAATLRQQQQQRQEQQLLQPPPPAQYAQIHAKSPIAAPANSAGGGRRPSTTIPGGSGARGASSGARTGAPSPSPSPHSPLSPAGAAASSPSAGRPPAEALDVVRLQEQLRETAAARDRAYGQLKTMVSSVEALTAEHASLRERLRASQAAVDDNRRTAVEFSDRLEASEALRKREHETASMAAERLRLDAQSVRRDLAAAQKAAEAEAGRRREAESRMEKAAAAHQAEVAALRARVDDSVRDAAAARQERDKAIAALQVFSAREVREALAQARVAVDEMQRAKEVAEADAAAGREAIADWRRRFDAADAAAASRAATLEAQVAQLRAEAARVAEGRAAAEDGASRAAAAHARARREAGALRLEAALSRVALQPVRRALRRWWAGGREAAASAAAIANDVQRTRELVADLEAARAAVARLDAELAATRRHALEAQSQLEGVAAGAAGILAALGLPSHLQLSSPFAAAAAAGGAAPAVPTPEALAVGATQVTHLATKAELLAALVPLLAGGIAATTRGRAAADAAALDTPDAAKVKRLGASVGGAPGALGEAMQQLEAAAVAACRAVAGGGGGDGGAAGGGDWRALLSARAGELEVRSAALDAATDAERRKLAIAEACQASLRRLHEHRIAGEGAAADQAEADAVAAAQQCGDRTHGAGTLPPLVHSASEALLHDTQAQLVVAQRGYARAEAEATKARALLRAAEADAERLEGELAAARVAGARARAETESLRTRSRVVLQEARESFSAEQATATRAREALEAENAELRSALVEARDALVAVDGPAGGPQQSALERLRAECDREILVVQEAYEGEVARLRAELDAARGARLGGLGPMSSAYDDGPGAAEGKGGEAEAERMVAWLREELVRVDAAHANELATLRQEAVFAIQAAEDKAAATVAKAAAWRSVQQLEEAQLQQQRPDRQRAATSPSHSGSSSVRGGGSGGGFAGPAGGKLSPGRSGSPLRY